MVSRLLVLWPQHISTVSGCWLKMVSNEILVDNCSTLRPQHVRWSCFESSYSLVKYYCFEGNWYQVNVISLKAMIYRVMIYLRAMYLNSNIIFSVHGGVGMRPGYGNTGAGGRGAVRQVYDQRQRGVSPVGWDKSYPLEPVEAVNNDLVNRTPLYKQNVSRNNSYNKYSGNYGPKAMSSSYSKRGMSLDRSKSRSSGAGLSGSMTRAHSQANIGHSSSEDSYTGSRPYSGLGQYHSSGNMRSRRQSGGSGGGGQMSRSAYDQGSPEESPPSQRKNYQTLSRDTRDYTRPMPPTYRRQKSMSRISDPSPSRHSYHDSAYSSHSSQSSDRDPSSAFSVISPQARPPLSTQSSPTKVSGQLICTFPSFVHKTIKTITGRGCCCRYCNTVFYALRVCPE